MRILMITALYPPILGGVPDHVATLNRTLTSRGHEVICLCGAEADSDAKQDQDLLLYRRSAMNAKSLLRQTMPDSAVSALLNRLLSDGDHKADLIHCHNAHLYGFSVADLAFQHAGLVPLVNTVHDHLGDGLRPEVLKRQWTYLIYVSTFVRRRLPSDRPSSVLPLGIDLASFTPEGTTCAELEKLERPIIYHPARLLPWKGAEIGLDAFIQVRYRLGRGTLVLTASKSAAVEKSIPEQVRRRLIAKATRAGLLDNLVFVDVAHDDLPAAMRTVDLVWYPTLGEEPFGLTPLEAMACGVPTVITDSGGMVEGVGALPGAIVVPRGDAQALAKAALNLLRNEAERRQVIAATMQHIKRFGFDTYVSRILDIYTEVIRR